MHINETHINIKDNEKITILQLFSLSALDKLKTLEDNDLV